MDPTCLMIQINPVIIQSQLFYNTQAKLIDKYGVPFADFVQDTFKSPMSIPNQYVMFYSYEQALDKIKKWVKERG